MKLAILLFALICITASASAGNVVNAINVLAKKKPCPNCGRTAEVPMTEEDMHNIRLEFIKAQILRKLQLEEVPKVTKLSKKLPVPITLVSSRPSTPPPPEFESKEDNVAKTNQIILLAVSEDDHEICTSQHRPAACFSFALPHDLILEDVESSELWIRKRHDFFDNDPHINQTLVYFDVSDNQMIELRRQSTTVEDGWICLTFTKNLKYWLANKNYAPKIMVLCPSCGNTTPWNPLSKDINSQPLLVINPNNIQKKRMRRNINCHSGVTECCREKLFVSFKEIKWDDWIIHPEGYDAYFCTGSCSGAASASLSSSLHSTVIRKLFHFSKRVDLVQCCAATQHSPITLIYLKDNQTVSSKTLPHMIVEACGCM